MSNVIDLSPVVHQLRGDGGPPDNDGMESRVAKLEAIAEKTSERLASMDKDLAVIKATHATKEDMAALRGDMISDMAALRGELAAHRGEMKAAVAEAKNSIIMWVVSAIFLAQLLPALLKRLGL